MSQLDGFRGLARDLRATANRMPEAVKKAAKTTAKKMAADARDMFGHYQEGWPQLDERTQQARERLGYTPDDPLLMSGALRDKVDSKVERSGAHEAIAFAGVEGGQTITGPTGASVDAALVAAVHETGTDDGHVPARPIWARIDHRLDDYARVAVDELMKVSKL
jgi:hypothetical protein